MTTIAKTIAIALLAGSTSLVQAFVYSDSDVFLVFRKDPAGATTFNDVEFNLGNVTNFLNVASGTTITVNNWDLTLTKAQYGGSLAQVKFLIFASTAATDPLRRVWATDAATTTPTDVAGSRLGQIQSKISYIASQAQTFTASNNSTSYVVSSGDPSSYSQICSTDPATIGSTTLFSVQGDAPATNIFYQLRINNSTPKPNAQQIGVFALTANGVLTFTAGSPLGRPQITTFGRSGNQFNVSFTTENNATYRLLFSADASANVSSWTSLGSIAGNGGTQTLTDSSATDPNRFYVIQASRP